MNPAQSVLSRPTLEHRYSKVELRPTGRPAKVGSLHAHLSPPPADTGRLCRLLRRSVITSAQRSQASGKAKQAVQTVKQAGPVARFADAQQSLGRNGIDLPELVKTCLIAGVTFGTAFQVTHNNGYLPAYDLWPFQIGPFLESGVIPFLLAPIWLLYGYLYPIVDEYFYDANVKAAQTASSKLSFVAATWTGLALTFILSDVLYLNNFPHYQISAILAITAIINWYTWDRTRTGLVLGALLAVGAPCTEALIVNFLHFWHYDRPDFFGVPHWAGWCYAAYAYGVGNFARWAAQQQQGVKS